MNFGYKYKGASKERLLLSVGTTVVPYTPQEPRVYNLVGLYGIWFKSKVGKTKATSRETLRVGLYRKI